MSKVEKLKLRDVEVLDAISTMSYGSSGSGSGSEGIIYKDECKEHKDCDESQFCESTGTWPFNYKKCRDMTTKERACKNKKWGDKCMYIEWLESSDGKISYPREWTGSCQSYSVDSPLWCTTLNSKPGRQ